MKTFYSYKGKDRFYVYDVVFAEPDDVIAVEGNNVVNISKTKREIKNCPSDILNNLKSRCTVITD